MIKKFLLSAVCVFVVSMGAVDAEKADKKSEKDGGICNIGPRSWNTLQGLSANDKSNTVGAATQMAGFDPYQIGYALRQWMKTADEKYKQQVTDAFVPLCKSVCTACSTRPCYDNCRAICCAAGVGAALKPCCDAARDAHCCE